MKVINPANGNIINSIQEDTQTSIDLKIDTLERGQQIWSKRPLEDRISCIIRFGELVLENIDELALILTTETGKPIQQSLNEINGAQNRIDHIVKYAKQWLANEVMVDDGSMHEVIRYEPLGIVANISAWNFPYNIGYNVFLYALISGNAVLYKHSELASLTGQKLEKYLHEAGVPENVFASVIGGADIGQIILEANLDGYFFTGSHKTGQHIAKILAPTLVPLQLELGGKDPLYVMKDVDIKQAAINAAEGSFYNNGQSCCAVERIYVAKEIYDDFITEFVQEVKSYKIGDPLDRSTFIGPLCRHQQINILKAQTRDAISRGAKLETGGNAIEGGGYYFNPTVLSNCNHKMLVMTEESFGPIIGIQKVESDEEATKLMLDSEYGLTSAVFSKDKAKAMAILDKMNTGTVYWNCCDRVSANLPWSGRKNSGIGSTLSSQGIRAFVQPKAYHIKIEE